MCVHEIRHASCQAEESSRPSEEKGHASSSTASSSGLGVHATLERPLFLSRNYYLHQLINLMLQILIALIVVILLTIPLSRNAYCNALETVSMEKARCDNTLGVVITMVLFVVIMFGVQAFANRGDY